MILGALSALGASLTWVVGSTVYAHLSRRVPPQTVNFNRALVSLPLFALVSLVQAGDVSASLAALGPAGVATRVAWLVLCIAMSYGIGDVCFLWASLSLGYPTAQAIGAIYPVWAALGGVVAGEPLSAQKCAGMALAVAGTIAVVLSGRRAVRAPPPEHLPRLKSHSVGVALALATSVFWAMNAFAASRGGAGMHPAFANVVRMSFALGFTASFGRAQVGRAFPFLLARADYVRFLPAFAVEAFLGSLLYIYGLSHTPIAVGATLSSTAPVLAVPVAVALGWERFSVRTLLAVLLVVAGVAVLMTG